MGGKYTEAQKNATNKYMKENLEIVSFRVKKGKRKAYNELAGKRETSLSNILESYLDHECEIENIPIILEKKETNTMKKLVRSIDKETVFYDDELEKAKKYYGTPDAKSLEEIADIWNSENSGDAVGELLVVEF